MTHEIKMHVHSTLRFPWLKTHHAKTDTDKRLHKALLDITRLLLIQASSDENMKTSIALLLLLGVGKADERLAGVFDWWLVEKHYFIYFFVDLTECRFLLKATGFLKTPRAFLYVENSKQISLHCFNFPERRFDSLLRA